MNADNGDYVSWVLSVWDASGLPSSFAAVVRPLRSISLLSIAAVARKMRASKTVIDSGDWVEAQGVCSRQLSDGPGTEGQRYIERIIEPLDEQELLKVRLFDGAGGRVIRDEASFIPRSRLMSFVVQGSQVSSLHSAEEPQAFRRIKVSYWGQSRDVKCFALFLCYAPINPANPCRSSAVLKLHTHALLDVLTRYSYGPLIYNYGGFFFQVIFKSILGGRREPDFVDRQITQILDYGAGG